ncbi:MAG: hypothetical protein JKY34_08215 [Kordiimonadaceae bacterium]|nr:hypothetical protein [Kordiimonadaceae bacterium]
MKQLAAVMIIKGHAKRAGIEKLEAGPKGIVISFRENKFANPAGLIDFISASGKTAKVRPDHKLVYYARMDKVSLRLKSVASMAKKLAKIATEAAT